MTASATMLTKTLVGQTKYVHRLGKIFSVVIVGDHGDKLTVERPTLVSSAGSQPFYIAMDSVFRPVGDGNGNDKNWYIVDSALCVDSPDYVTGHVTSTFHADRVVQDMLKSIRTEYPSLGWMMLTEGGGDPWRKFVAVYSETDNVLITPTMHHRHGESPSYMCIRFDGNGETSHAIGRTPVDAFQTIRLDENDDPCKNGKYGIHPALLSESLQLRWFGNVTKIED